MRIKETRGRETEVFPKTTPITTSSITPSSDLSPAKGDPSDLCSNIFTLFCSTPDRSPLPARPTYGSSQGQSAQSVSFPHFLGPVWAQATKGTQLAFSKTLIQPFTNPGKPSYARNPDASRPLSKAPVDANTASGGNCAGSLAMVLS